MSGTKNDGYEKNLNSHRGCICSVKVFSHTIVTDVMVNVAVVPWHLISGDLWYGPDKLQQKSPFKPE